MKKRGKHSLLDGHPIQTVSRTAYWKAVRDMVTRLGGKKYSHTYVRECANGIKSLNDKKMAFIKEAIEKVPLIPVNRINHGNI
jgi:hypothetical protein